MRPTEGSHSEIRRGKKPGSRHVLEKLTAIRVDREKRQGRYSDGGGLYLQVGPTGGKSWLFRYMRAGKSREMGLGTVASVPMARARALARQYREALAAGRDPIQERDAAREAEALERSKGKTFKSCAEAYIASHREGWRNAKHVSQWENTLAQYVYPVIGALPVADVTTGHVLEVLEPIWASKTETASRVRGRMESVLNWASVRAYRSGDNPARWRGHLAELLPKRSKVAQVKHHRALPYPKIGAFMRDLRAQGGLAARALELIILTATRTREVIEARWDEIDLGAATWTIPAERMKAGRPHRVPLSAPALTLLKELKTHKVNDFVFPGTKDQTALSNMACLALLDRMGRRDITVHGFRSTFRDWAAEQTSFPNIVAEAALAHTIGDKAEAAYRRGDLMNKRRQMMDRWADYCAKAHGGEVVSIGKARANR